MLKISHSIQTEAFEASIAPAVSLAFLQFFLHDVGIDIKMARKELDGSIWSGFRWWSLVKMVLSFWIV
jgi:hypothetical protein